MYKRRMNIEYFFNPLNGTFPNGAQIIKYIQMSIRKRASACLHILLCGYGLKSASHAELAVLYMQIGISYDYIFCYISVFLHQKFH